MNWLNLETATLDSEEFVGAEPIERATWLCLLRYCIGQENSGIIAECRNWPDRKWQQLARVTKAEVESVSSLWIWEGDNLRVWRYPADKEVEVQQRRNRARTNGRSGGRPTSEPTSEPTSVILSQTNKEPTLVISGKAEGEWKEKEKEKDKDKENIPPPADADEGAGKVATLPDPRHHAITSQWGERYAKHFGCAYVFAGKDAANLKKFLRTCKDDAETILSVAEKAWTRTKTDRFAGSCKLAATISGLCGSFNEIRAHLAIPADKSPQIASNGRSWDPATDGGSVILR